MATNIKTIRGMTPEAQAKFSSLQITDTDQLLQSAATVKRRRELAEELGLDAATLLELANRADLSRIKGIADVYADLLEQAGVDTVKELAARVPEHLHAKLLSINERAQLTQHPPRLEQIEAWVAEAKSLPKILEY